MAKKPAKKSKTRKVAAKRRMVRSPMTLTPPAVGQYWKGQGGIYAGLMRGNAGKPDYHLILATADASKFRDVEYGLYGTEVTGAGDEFDGAANTAALAKAGSNLAKKLQALKIDGHADFYLPARFESALLYATVRDHLETAYWHWTSTQYSAYNAWYQGFSHGGQYWDSKDDKGRARAVRRIQA